MLLDLVAKQWQAAIGLGNIHDGFNVIGWNVTNCKANTPANQKKRAMYFGTRRTTSHWAAPIKVNGLQPQVYGDKTKLLDYSKLPQPILDDLNWLDLV